jgi:hypothetical protein
MSFYQGDIEWSPNEESIMLSSRYILIANAIIIPIFCVCMMSALGASTSVRQVVIMQFDVDANTEFIALAEVLNLNPNKKIEKN